MNKFVVTSRIVRDPRGILVKKDDVGIIESESKKSTLILFVRVGKKARLQKKDFQVFNPQKTGDSFPKKICNVCHKLLPTKEFAKNQNAKNNRPVRRPSCSNCRKILEGVSPNMQERREWLKNKPHNEVFRCPICHKRTIADITSKVVLDHDHRSGKIRGWICDSCNTGIGRFKDEVALLRKAIKFLK